MWVLRTRLALVFGGIAVLAAGAIVALRAGAGQWAVGLLAAQILFAGSFLYLVCGRIHRHIEALTRSVESGGAVVANGDLAPLGKAIEQLIQSRDSAMASCQQHLNVVLESWTRARRGTQALMDALPHGIALLSPAGRVELVNPRAAWFGLEHDKSVDEAPHVWLKGMLSRAIDSRQRTGLTDCQDRMPDETPACSKCREGLVQMFEEGRELFFLPQAYPLIDAQGELTGVVLTFVDVTAARQADEARAGLLASFSHEIRTPMTSLQMSIYLLLDDAASRLTPRQLELLQAARDDADRLHRIVEGALTRQKP
jgi:two-component system, NtrC family, sensor histidine kinase KinB